MTDTFELLDLPDPRPQMDHDPTPAGSEWRGPLPLAHLVTDAAAMTDTITAHTTGRVSQSPTQPVELCLREGYEGRYEIVDGHHRIAQALADGETTVQVIIHGYIDDEPYEGPFWEPPIDVPPLPHSRNLG